MNRKITIVGLGPGGEDYLTMAAYKAIVEGSNIYLRTLKHPIVKMFEDKGVTFESFDGYYDKFETFEEVYNNIAKEVIRLSGEEEVVYAVPGNPFVAEKTVELILEAAQKEVDLDLEIIHGASFIDAIVTTLKKDPVNGLKILDGLELDENMPQPTLDNLIIQVYNKTVASDVKLKLMEVFDDDDEVTIVRAAGIPSMEKIVTLPLYEMDMVDEYDHLTSIYISKIDAKKRKKYFVNDLEKLMTTLRSIDGCPWDREQTHESLKRYLLEESYEVIEAIEKDDLWGLEEELGDVLFQILFHSEIASENGYFSLTDVITTVYEKMVRRHPHVFDKTRVDGTDEVLVNWDKIKSEEKGNPTHTELMTSVSKSFPALVRAEKIQKKAAKVGFDWDNLVEPMAKVKEEIDELQEIIDLNHHERDKDDLEDEMGDIIFAATNLARKLGISSELALQKTIEKFVNRFGFIEESDLAKSKGLEHMSLSEMDLLWDEAKKQEKNNKI